MVRKNSDYSTLLKVLTYTDCLSNSNHSMMMLFSQIKTTFFNEPTCVIKKVKLILISHLLYNMLFMEIKLYSAFS